MRKLSDERLDKIHAAYQREFEAWDVRHNRARLSGKWEVFRLEPGAPIDDDALTVERRSNGFITAEAWLHTLRGRAAAKAAVDAMGETMTADQFHTTTYADGNVLVLADGRRIGPFSSHWAACAAMIRRSNPDFRSLGGDKPEDLAIEKETEL